MIAQQMGVEVKDIGEDVRLQIGNVSWLMHYETALHLSQAIRQAGRASKRFAGDLSRSYGVGGLLHDASNPNAGQPYNPGRVPNVNKNLTTKDDIKHVFQKGKEVEIRIKDITFAMPYAAAIVVSQWLRIRAKAARNRAGDTRHWAKMIASLQ